MRKTKAIFFLYISLIFISLLGCGNYPPEDKFGQAYDEFTDTITVSAAQPYKEANITLYYPDGSTVSYDFKYSSIVANSPAGYGGNYKTIYYLDGAKLFICQNS